MAVVGGAVQRVDPSHIIPQTLMQYNQPSGAFMALAGENPQVQLEEGDLFVYAKRLEVRTKVAAGQAAYNQIPSCSLVLSQLSTPTYLIRTRAEYDHHDTAAASRWGISISEAHRLAMRQGIFQQTRNALLYGFVPSNGEGLLNANGATAINLPADPNGNTTVATYDNGAMAIFILTLIQQAKARTFQLGQPSRIVIVGPQRVLGMMEYQNIVQVSQFQRAGAGSASTAGMIKEIALNNGDKIDWVYDDTLQGKGAGNTDVVLVVIPEIELPKKKNRIDTNEFAGLQPGLSACTLQMMDMAAPREIPTPLAGGAIDVLSEMRITSGWGIRPEGITIASMLYQ